MRTIVGRTKTVVHWFDGSIISQATNPRKVVGVLFLIEFVTFLIFLVCLALLYQEQMIPQQSLLTDTAVTNLLGFDQGKSNLDTVKSYLLSILGSSKFPNITDRTAAFLVTHRVLGSFSLTQQRSGEYTCVKGVTSFACVSDAVATGFERFSGKLADIHLDYVSSNANCISVMCSPGFRSSQTNEFFRDEGLRLYSFGGVLYVNSSSYFNESIIDVMDAFLDRFTRFVSLQGVLLDSEGQYLTLFSINFEMTIAGGVFAWLNSHTLLLNTPSSCQQYAAVVWFYCAAFLLVTIARSVIGILHRENCAACSSSVAGFCATSCFSCGKPICLDIAEATKCSWCGVSIQPIQHTCWRTQLDPSRIVPLLNITLIIVGSIFANTAQTKLTSTVGEFLSHQVPMTAPPVIDVAPLVDQITQSTTLNAFNILVAFVCLYRYIGRAPGISRFLRVFSTGGFLMGFFFMGFSVVFFGFLLSFHLLLGETTLGFATLLGAFASTFQLLLGLLDWTSVSASLYSSSFTALYLSFCWMCVLVMVNVLISMVTAEYKRARKTKEFDLEMESCRLLIGQGKSKSTSTGSTTTESIGSKPNVAQEQAQRVAEELHLDADSTLPLVHSVRANIDQFDQFGKVFDETSRSIQRIAGTLHRVNALVQSVS